VHKPQVRYTYLAGNGLTIAASAEMPTSTDMTIYTANGATAATTFTTDNSGVVAGYGIIQIPDLAAAVQWDQPWGHVRFAGMYHDSYIDNSTANLFTTGQNSYKNDVAGYFMMLSGHVNTWGKDALRGDVAYDVGVAEAANTSFGTDRVLGPGGFAMIEKAWIADLNYEHFFTSQWRGNVSAGLSKFVNGSLPQGNSAVSVGLTRMAWTAHANMIFSPVPQTDFITEWETGHTVTYSGAHGTDNKVVEQFKFYF
jgi:hypothetical protein